MAISGSTVWEVRTTGNDANGGAFVAGASGTDYSQQDAAQYSGTDLAVDGTTNTKVTSASHNFVATDVGNILRVTSGTGWTAGFYQIVSVASNAATLDRSPAATSTTGGSYCVGGAFASPGQAGAAKIQGNDVFIKAGTYTLGSSSANVSGGIVSDTTGGVASSNHSWWVGYSTNRTRNNTDEKPLIQVPASSVTSVTVMEAANINVVFYNLQVDGASKTGIVGFGISTGANFGGARMIRCKATNCPTGFSVAALTSVSQLISCEATGFSAAGFNGSGPAFYHACEAHDGTAVGFVTEQSVHHGCVSYNNSGASSDGFSTTGINGSYVGCQARSNGRSGFFFNTSSSRSHVVANCVAMLNAAFGFNASVSGDAIILLNCAGYSNTSGNVGTNVASSFGFVTLTGDPNVSSTNLGLNATAGAGGACRAASYPGLYPSGNFTSYADLGGVQHADAGGGLFMPRGFSGGLVG